MEIKEVKTTRYGGKCAKCGRVLEKGWTIGFEPITKLIFCKPDMAELMKLNPKQLKAEIDSILAKRETAKDKEKDTSQPRLACISEEQFTLLIDYLGKVEKMIIVLNEQVDSWEQKHLKTVTKSTKK